MEQNILVDVVLYGLIVHSVEITTGKYSQSTSNHVIVIYSYNRTTVLSCLCVHEGNISLSTG